MNLKEARIYFENELSKIYPDEQELSSIYFMLLPAFSGFSKIDSFLNSGLKLTAPQQEKLFYFIDKLRVHTPVQYLLGKVSFLGLEILVDKSVLIPRPETEELCDLIIRENNLKTGLKVLDLCSGSGCITLAMSKYLNTIATGVELSPDAVITSEKNAALNKIQVKIIQDDILRDDFKLHDTYDIIVSNPPYVPINEKVMMDRNVLDHEPHMALFPLGEDPLVFYIRIAELAGEYLQPGGILYFEIHSSLNYELKLELAKYKFRSILLLKDLSGKFRFIKCVK